MVPCDVTMGLFEPTNTFRIAMATQITDLLSLYNLLTKLITYVKDESGNLSTLAQAFTSIFSYGPLGLTIPWQGSCFGHAFSKVCQYAFNDIKDFIGFKEVNLKPIQFNVAKIITRAKKFGKGHSQ
jgi:hypothetical protein